MPVFGLWPLMPDRVVQRRPTRVGADKSREMASVMR